MSMDLRTAVRRSLPALALAALSLPLSWFLPRMNLAARPMVLVSWWTTTASLWGAVALALALVSVLASGSDGWRCRGKEALIHVVVLAVLLGGAAWANEHLLKPALGAYRPQVVRLAELDVLGMPPERFYESMERQERRAHLQEILEHPDFDAVTLSPPVRNHWIRGTGYSLPSGHALTAMCLATYFLVMGIRFAGRRWMWLFYLLPIWAVSVGWSRVLLEVHSSWDVVWGGVLGGLLGGMAIAASSMFLRDGAPGGQRDRCHTGLADHPDAKPDRRV